ncbi:hypothetical protein TNCV_1395981 [Trichonephila clavipes]|nr:hypothetical protein TNCV_1395981 [Trichonephila clavipes]
MSKQISSNRITKHELERYCLDKWGKKKKTRDTRKHLLIPSCLAEINRNTKAWKKPIKSDKGILCSTPFLFVITQGNASADLVGVHQGHQVIPSPDTHEVISLAHEGTGSDRSQKRASGHPIRNKNQFTWIPLGMNRNPA